MFGRKSRIELLEEMARLEDERDKLRKSLDILESKFKEYSAKCESMPDDCEPGSWCDACRFQGTIHLSTPIDPYTLSRVHYCKKGMSCKHFVARGEEKND